MSNSEKIWEIRKKGMLNSEMIWKTWKKILKRFGKYGRNISLIMRYGKYGRKDLENTEKNSKMIGKIWKKGKLNSEKIWKI